MWACACPYSMLAYDRTDTVELIDVHRFYQQWEKLASLDLRHGHTTVIDTYLAHGRIRDGDTETITDAAYTAWRADRDAGRITVLIAEAREQVTALNERARADLLTDESLVQDREVELRDGSHAGIGDTIITRCNDRKIAASTGNDWVRNGGIWTVTDVRGDGSLTIRRPGRSYGSAIVLPAAYVAEHVDLGYAVTAHRAQGVTTDTAHVLVEPTATRETFYIAMTRGRAANHAYVILDRADDHQQPHPGDDPNASSRSVLTAVLQHVGAELSAHETITTEQEQWGSIAQLAAEYETIAAAAQHDRWASLVRTSGLTADQAQAAVESEAFGPLTAELRRAEANHHDIETLLPRVVAARGFNDADDIAAVIHYRVAHATARPAGRGRARKAPRLIVGLIPHADGVHDTEMRAALDEREALIESRADAVLDSSLTDKATWTEALGTPPRDAHRAAAWRKAARAVAAYRDRYRITDDTPLGAPSASEAQKIDADRARAAVAQAAETAGTRVQRNEPRPVEQRSLGRSL